jgi:hypothetical protein
MGIIEAGAIPSGLLEIGIVGFAFLEIGLNEGSVARLPG